MPTEFDSEVAWLTEWIAARNPKAAQVHAETEFVESGLLDSFGVIELIAAAETRFDMRFTEDDFADPAFGTPRGFMGLVEKRRRRG